MKMVDAEGKLAALRITLAGVSDWRVASARERKA
jgi:hypothetical protein